MPIPIPSKRGWLGRMFSRALFVVILFIAFHANLYAGCFPNYSYESIEPLLIQEDKVALRDYLIENHGPESDFSQSTNSRLELNESMVRHIATELVIGIFESLPFETNERTKFIKSHSRDITNDFFNGIRAACLEIMEGSSLRDIDASAKESTDLVGGNSDYYFYLGTSNSLTKDGDFDSGLEAALVSTSVYRYRNFPLLGKSMPDSRKKLLGRVELVYAEIGQIDDDEVDSVDSTQLNPFAVGGGYLRFNMSVDPYFTQNNNTEGVGLRIGTGFSTHPFTESENIDTSARLFGGVVFKANYGNDQFGRKGKGEIFIGIARDNFWKYSQLSETADTLKINESDRVIIDGSLDLPGVFESKNVRLLTRFYSDIPASGDGPRNIRFSLIFTINIGKLFNLNL
ncbi:MAG: hypothetical protein KTR35_03505 [Gammaproteobacteria bacterium]|nr:hypothetical protein [Gammaproteobacteria bacterium]